MSNTQLVKQIREMLEDKGLENPINFEVFNHIRKHNLSKLEGMYGGFLEQLGFKLDSQDLQDTPRRVVDYYLNDLFYGLDYANFPEISVTANDYLYTSPIIAKGITINSVCEHHLTSITGKATVFYCVTDKVIGLSCINKIINFFSHRPQVQERLSRQILEVLKLILGHDNVAIIIQAQHDCIIKRGLKEASSQITTIETSGDFNPQGKYASYLSMNSN